MSQLERKRETNESITFSLKNDDGVEVSWITYNKPGIDYDGWEIKSLLTRIDYRHQGYATKLLNESCRVVQQMSNVPIFVVPSGSFNAEELLSLSPEEMLVQGREGQQGLIALYKGCGFSEGDGVTLRRPKSE